MAKPLDYMSTNEIAVPRKLRLWAVLLVLALLTAVVIVAVRPPKPDPSLVKIDLAYQQLLDSFKRASALAEQVRQGRCGGARELFAWFHSTRDTERAHIPLQYTDGARALFYIATTCDGTTLSPDERKEVIEFMARSSPSYTPAIARFEFGRNASSCCGSPTTAAAAAAPR